MPTVGLVGRVRKEGGGRALYLPKAVYEVMGLLPGDLVAFRLYKGCAVIERVPLELLARLKEMPVPLYARTPAAGGTDG